MRAWPRAWRRGSASSGPTGRPARPRRRPPPRRRARHRLRRLAIRVMSRRAATALSILTAACLGLLARAAVHGGGGIAAPPGMVYFAGGRTRIGSDDGEPSERPPFDADVAPFLLDAHPVTVAEFRRFADATRYVTQ